MTRSGSRIPKQVPCAFSGANTAPAKGGDAAPTQPGHAAGAPRVARSPPATASVGGASWRKISILSAVIQPDTLPAWPTSS